MRFVAPSNHFSQCLSLNVQGQLKTTMYLYFLAFLRNSMPLSFNNNLKVAMLVDCQKILFTYRSHTFSDNGLNS